MRGKEDTKHRTGIMWSILESLGLVDKKDGADTP